MPAKNAQKIYIEDGYYHVYNRGVEKRDIFLNLQDYAVFIKYLTEYLSPRNEKARFDEINDPNLSWKERARMVRNMSLSNFNSEITLMAYCLMPNHFHLFLKQSKANALDRFMSSLGTRYTMYFNRTHNRVGKLYQGVYKAVLMTDESQFLHITRYIHRQALVKSSGNGEGFPSSYPDYVGLKKTEWVHPEEILGYFSKTDFKFSYESFVKEYNPLFDIADKNLDF
jgi:putative transposase